jgi:hypothetical protein
VQEVAIGISEEERAFNERADFGAHEPALAVACIEILLDSLSALRVANPRGKAGDLFFPPGKYGVRE